MALLEDFRYIIRGGFPENGVLVLRGVPASGKTIFSLTLVNELLERGNRCIYVTTELSPDALKKQVCAEFSWDFERHEREGRLLFLDGYSWRLEKRGQGIVNLSNLTEVGHAFSELVGKGGGKLFFVFDSITSLMLYNDPTNVAKFLQVQVARLRDMGASGLFVMETGIFEEDIINLLSFFVDGFLELKVQDENGVLQSYFRVSSVRNAKHQTLWIPCYIESDGFKFASIGIYIGFPNGPAATH